MLPFNICIIRVFCTHSSTLLRYFIIASFKNINAGINNIKEKIQDFAEDRREKARFRKLVSEETLPIRRASYLQQKKLQAVEEGQKIAKKEMLVREEKEKVKNEKFDSKRAVACLREPIPAPIVEPVVNIVKPVKADDNKPAPVGNLKTEVPMTKEELKKESPVEYEAIMKEGADSERGKNNERVKALTAMKADEDYKDMPEILEVIDKAIMDGGTVETVTPKITIAVMKIMKDPARMAKIESPGSITPGDGEDLTPETKQNAEV